MSYATIKTAKVEQRNGYYLITTEKGNRLGDWREGKKAIGIYPLKVGEVYTIEYRVGGKEGQYFNLEYADRDKPAKTIEEI